MRTLKAALVITAAVAAGGCGATTKFNSTWRNPEAAPGSLHGQKVVAMVVSPNEATRRGAEEALARALTALGVQGVAAYSIFPTASAQDKDRAKAAFDKFGAVGVVTMRVIGQEKEINSTGGMWYAQPSYGSFWGGGYYGWGWGAVYSPGYLRTDTVVSVETLVYSLKQDKLVWAGRSETTNPSRVDTFVKELADLTAQHMKKAGLIIPAAK